VSVGNIDTHVLFLEMVNIKVLAMLVIKKVLENFIIRIERIGKPINVAGVVV